MVDRLPLVWLLLAAQDTDRKVPEPTRTIVLMALLGILLVGMVLIAGTMLGAHWVRRLGEYRRGPVVPTDVMVPRTPPQPTSPANPKNSSTSETFSGDDTVGSDDTVVL